MTTVAGVPTVPGYRDGSASQALFTHPTWLDVVVSPDGPQSCDEGTSGEIFVVDRINQVIRYIDAQGNVSTFTIQGRLGAPLTNGVNFDSAFGGGILVEPPYSGCGCGIYARGIWVASSGTNQVMLAGFHGVLASRDDWFPIVGSGQAGAANGTEVTAQFHTPTGIGRSWTYINDVGSNVYGQSIYVADTANDTIRRFGFILSFEACPQARNIETLAGLAGAAGSADGKGAAARFNTPRGVAGAPDGSVYVTDSGNHTIRRIAPDGTVTTVAGEAGVSGSNDGPALQAHFNTPSGIDVDSNGNVFIVDTFNHTIRELTKDGNVITVAGQPGVSGFADGDGNSARFNAPVGLKVAPDGSLVVADTGNNCIRRVTFDTAK